MSFFKKLKEEFGGSSSGEQGYPAQGGGYPQGGHDQYNRPPAPSQHSSYGQQAPYGQPQQPSYSVGARDAYGGQQQSTYYNQQQSGPPSGYGERPPYPPHQSSYGGSPAPYGERPPPPQSGYGSSPASYGGGAPPPPVPGQWIPVFSAQHQRWYFVETTGRALWDAPVYIAPQPPMPAYGDYDSSRGAEYGGAPPSGDYRGSETAVAEAPKEDHDKRNMMLAAGGALAVGVVGGAVIAEALGMFSCPLPSCVMHAGYVSCFN